MQELWYNELYASVAQLFRALPCQGRGRELESLRSHHITKIARLSRFFYVFISYKRAN